MSFQSEVLTLNARRLQRQATPPTLERNNQEEWDEEGDESGDPRSPVVATPMPMPTSQAEEMPVVELENPASPPSVQQLLAQPGFSSGVFIHTGPRHPEFASLASRY